MLVVHPSSSCDICLEQFRSGLENTRQPCAIQCGHIFCQSCIDSFPRLVCPLCRVHFDPRSIRRLHVDLATPQGSPAAPVISTLGEVDVEKEKLKARLISMVREGADGTRFGNLKGEAEAWLQQQTADDHWDLRALLTLIVRYHEYHKREQLALRELREAEANNKALDQTNFDLAEALELSQKDVARLQEEMYEGQEEEIRSLRAEVLYFSEKNRAQRQPSGLSRSRPAEETDIELLHTPAPVPPPIDLDLSAQPSAPSPPRTESNVPTSTSAVPQHVVSPLFDHLEDEDTGLFHPEAQDRVERTVERAERVREPRSRRGTVTEPPPRTERRTSMPAEGAFSTPKTPKAGLRRNSTDPQPFLKPAPVVEKGKTSPTERDTSRSKTAPMVINGVAARFYETIQSSPSGASSLPHPMPATYYSRRQEKTRENALVSRARADSASTPVRPQTPTRPKLSKGMQQRVSRLQLQLVPDSSDEEVIRRAQRRDLLKDILADPGATPGRAPPPPPPPPPPPMLVSRASSAARQFEIERARRRAEGQGTPTQSAQGTPTSEQTGFKFDQTPMHPRRFLERRDSASSARGPVEATRVWRPTMTSGIDSEA
ncbi:unnamed protein product [Peniophora sp. CBMAI 1063]|nr:unnamed protein product [Peniophora sp. CBMAI 1063]